MSFGRSKGTVIHENEEPIWFKDDFKVVQVIPTEAGIAVRYSSAMPWISAVLLSVGIWSALGLVIWRFLA